MGDDRLSRHDSQFTFRRYSLSPPRKDLPVELTVASTSAEKHRRQSCSPLAGLGSSSSSSPSPAFSRNLSSFQVKGQLGEGEFAVVHEAYDVSKGEAVALKILKPKVRLRPHNTPMSCYSRD